MNNSKLKNILQSKGFKIASISLIIGCSIAGGYIAGFESAKGLPATYKYYSSNKTLATVGSTKIKMGVLKKQMEMYFASQPQKEFTKEEIAEQEQTYIDYIIMKESLKQKALAEGLTVADEVVNAQYETLVGQLENLYGLTMDEIFKKYDITEKYIKEAVKEELLGNAYLDTVGVATDEEATTYFNEHPEEFVQCEASHILIKTIDDNYESLSDEKIEEARVRAQEILNRALAGEDFAELAKTCSEDASAQDGGELGYFGLGEMAEAFEDAAFALNVGEITTELVQTEFGFHIIKKTGEKDIPLEDAIEGIKDDLAYQKKYKVLIEILDSPDIVIEYGN